jgi:hypothetical protein
MAESEADITDPETQRRIRERVTRLAFGGDPKRFDEFVGTLNDATPDANGKRTSRSTMTGRAPAIWT